ncbi:hypothetical protein SCLCIDRAFT_853671 [Scleroderma citrinum Foug A]|uniref:Uncharacterized protein n=1 Tax=Scleroderma citrinum Foug A TaxID=1036808 RepID=A0A0C3DMV6_9AGAM|nr:hypothetical protein SCLCIDRAFT_853671 [Scleroderma citrinum Foug A]
MPVSMYLHPVWFPSPHRGRSGSASGVERMNFDTRNTRRSKSAPTVSDKTWHQGACNRLVVQAPCDASPGAWGLSDSKHVLHAYYRRYLCRWLRERLKRSL